MPRWNSRSQGCRERRLGGDARTWHTASCGTSSVASPSQIMDSLGNTRGNSPLSFALADPYTYSGHSISVQATYVHWIVDNLWLLWQTRSVLLMFILAQVFSLIDCCALALGYMRSTSKMWRLRRQYATRIRTKRR